MSSPRSHPDLDAPSVVFDKRKPKPVETNRVTHQTTTVKPDVDYDEAPRAKPDLDLRIQVARARLAMKMTQAELASRLAVRVSIVQEFEAGRTTLNSQTMSRIKTILNMHANKKTTPKPK